MPLSPLAGKPAPKDLLIDVAKLERDYSQNTPDLGDPTQLVSFGTSGHRGTPLNGTFTEAHILAVTQAICEYRAKQGIDGPLVIGKDTHAVSGPAPGNEGRKRAVRRGPFGRATPARQRTEAPCHRHCAPPLGCGGLRGARSQAGPGQTVQVRRLSLARMLRISARMRRTGRIALFMGTAVM